MPPLSRAQRLLAWFGFVSAALMSPVAAVVINDASWLFSACVAGLVAVVILADDKARRAARQSDY